MDEKIKELAIDFKGWSHSGPAGQWREAALWACERFKEDGRLDWIGESLRIDASTPGGWLPGAVQEDALAAFRGVGAAMQKAGEAIAAGSAGWLGVGGAWMGEACASASDWFKSDGPRLRVSYDCDALRLQSAPSGGLDGDVYPGKVGALKCSLVLPADGVKGTGLAFGSFVEERFGKEAFRRFVCSHELAHAMHNECGKRRKSVFYGHEEGRASPLDALLCSKSFNLGFCEMATCRFQEAFADAAACLTMARGDPVALKGWAMEVSRERNKMLMRPGKDGGWFSMLSHDARDALLELARLAPTAAVLDEAGQWKLCMRLARKSAAGLLVELSNSKERIGDMVLADLALGMFDAVAGGKTLERAGVEIKYGLSIEEFARFAEKAKGVKAELSEQFGPFAFGLGKRADSTIVKTFGAAREASMAVDRNPGMMGGADALK